MENARKLPASYRRKDFIKDRIVHVKATVITNWLKEDFTLGYRHATAMYAYLKGKRE